MSRISRKHEAAYRLGFLVRECTGPRQCPNPARISSTSGPQSSTAGCVDSLGSLRPSLLDAGKPWRILGKRPILDVFHVAASALFLGFWARARSEGNWVEKGASSDAPAGAHTMAVMAPARRFVTPPTIIQGSGCLVKSPWLQQKYYYAVSPTSRMQYRTGIQKEASRVLVG